MFTLDSFYRSREWSGLLKQLKLERINADGEIVCEYCGKPITKAYDMIGHHKEYLTEENVNDLSISLNPENISFVHHRCHNYIHNKLGYSSRMVYIVYGAPFSGKRTWVRNNCSGNDLVIDMDDIWMCITGNERYKKNNRLKSIAFSVRDGLLNAVKYRAGKWSTAYVIGGYALSSERRRLCSELGAREVFIEADKQTCFDRLENMNDDSIDKDEYRKYIEEWFEKFSRNP